MVILYHFSRRTTALSYGGYFIGIVLLESV